MGYGLLAAPAHGDSGLYAGWSGRGDRSRADLECCVAQRRLASGSFDIGASPFPLQLLAALLLGVLNAPRLSLASLARWVWVVPSFALLLRLFSWKPYSTLIAETPWQHFFGPCLRLYCPEQFTVTLPFYASLAYSLGYIIDTARRPGDFDRQLTTNH